jgi:hypothetical protein
MILFIICLNICIAIGDPVIKRRVGIPLSSITLPHFCACPKPGAGFPTSKVLKVPDDVMEGQEFDQSVYYVCPDFHSLYISLVVTIYLNDC